MTEEEKTSYLRRRDGIIEVLDTLQGSWDLAEGLSALIRSAFVTPELIDRMESVLREAIKTAKDATAKEKIQAGLNRIEEMKRMEIEERASEQKNLETSVLEHYI